jgi:phytoene/squalene synthetase
MRPWSFYQHWLDAVSRSFAMCIPQLDPPFRDHVGLAYLLFRVLDTVEDAPFAEQATQQRQFDRMRSFLRTMPAPSVVDAFVATFPAAITEGERGLLGQTYALLEDGHALPAPARRAMFRALDRMALGMAAYMRRPPPLRLLDVEDVARYCCFVAGVVGEMLSELWGLARGAPAPAAPLAYHFGLFLQKVNILKDQREDEAAGRFLVPDRDELLASLARDAEGALAYLQAIPPGDRYRIFCGWSLMLGAATVAQLDQPKQSRRADAVALLARTSSIVDDDDALAQLLVELMPALPDERAHAVLAKPESYEWFRRTLAAPLSEPELRRLGIVDGGLRASGFGFRP